MPNSTDFDLAKYLPNVDLSILTKGQLTILERCWRLSNCAAYLERSKEPMFVPIAPLIEKISNKLTKAADKASEACVLRYEVARSEAAGRTVIASRTRQVAKKVGYRSAIENAVVRFPKVESSGFQMLVKTKKLDSSYEVLIINNPQYFSEEAIHVAKDRLKKVGYN